MGWLSVVFLISSACWADTGAPSWALNPPKDTSSAKFYVGSSARAGTYAEAIELASKSALEQAIRQSFGVDASVTNQSYETTTSAAVTTSVSEVSRRVHVQGFETQDARARHDDDGWSAWMLFKYSKDEIEAERRRLRSVSVDHEQIKYNEVSGQAGVTGRLEITTEPEGVRVLIDGKETLYRTPIRLSGVIDVGQHIVELDDPSYMPIVREVILQPGQTTSIKELLVPAVGSLAVTTIPPNAAIMVDGKMVGTSPIQDVPVPANKIVKLEFLHPDAERSSQETRVARDEHREITQRLPLKPASIQVAVTPVRAMITIDGHEVVQGWTTLDPGHHTIAARMDGFEDASAEVDLRGGERRSQSLRLVPLSEIRRHREVTPWIFGLGFSSIGAGSDDPSDRSAGAIAFRAEKKLSRYIGLGVGVDLFADQAKATDAPTKRDMNGSALTAFLPVYVMPEVYVGPAISRSAKSFTCSSAQASATCPPPSTLRQFGVGGTIGWQHFFSEAWGFKLGADVYKMSSDGATQGKVTGEVQALLLFRY